MKNKIEEDLRILKGMLIYCEDIELTLNRFGRNYEVFTHDRVFFHAVSMSLMQVGEMANKLTDEFKERTNDQVNWYKLKAIRNLFAHAYSNINKRHVWQFVTVFTPVYAEFCRQEIIFLQNEIL
ncbi:antitoxin [Enterococcus villorum]|uniref:Antitoxin n=1 Tax=Enterococcus villorum TaxID=112904 RepID=A0A1V8YUD7_9ENTE|nr:HepT-like ribonuclease domain-containing protein [Enterococcus villorum]OQO71647.1 antitoxin [Enterococcus villorum]OQO76209.1 antitoxin [Enterococcus villorum]